jgi:hypothetical protein
MAKKFTDKNREPSKALPGANPFGDTKGEKFGGGATYLQMEENTVQHGFVYTKLEKDVELSKGVKPTDISSAIHPEIHEEIRLPASAVFQKLVEQAKLSAGDVFSIARLPDAIKKTNPGKGKAMSVYSILVTKRHEQKGKKPKK